MSLLKYVMGIAVATALVACGGGGGSAGTTGSGTTGSGTTGSTTVTGVPTIALRIVDSAGSSVLTNAIGNGAIYYAQATVKDADGAAVGNKLVSFSTDSNVATLAQTSALTDVTTGIAKVQLTPASLTENAGNLVASATVNTVAVSADLDYKTSASNVTLANFAVAQTPISALQSVAVTVNGLVNGGAAGSGVVTVDFSATCGSFSPSSASTNSAGTVSTTYQSAVNCSGVVVLTASGPSGTVPATTSINVTSAQAANVVFSSATVPLMVSSSATSGLKQSTLKFQVLDGSGLGMSGQNVNITLTNPTSDAGVRFSVGGVSTLAAQVVTTDSSGFASVTVTSGSLPTPVVVAASLIANPAITASSSGIAVTSGRATQNAASLSATKLSIEGFNVDGVQTTLTMRVADRQGNPVPAGAVVNFVAAYGLVQGSCTIDANSGCSVTYTTQGLRPTNGRVAILAYMDGEESFVDQNGDNIWQFGEPFFDIGTLYRDDNENDIYDASAEQTYPGGATGPNVCSSVVYAYPSVINSCDNTWSGNVRVRRQIIIALATTQANVTLVTARTLAGFVVRVSDAKGNAMPTGTTVGAAVVTSGATCKVTSTSPDVVINSPNAGNHAVRLDGSADCATVRVDVTVTPPSALATVAGF